MDALTTYRLFTANTERTLQRISQTPEVARDVEYYLENIGNVNSAEDLVEDRRLLEFALKAYGLEEMAYAKALMQKLLNEGTDETSALANQLADPRYKEFAEDFNFARYGSATTSFTRTQEGLVEKFYQARLETEAGNNNTGARLAIYFEKKATDIEGPLDVLGDRALTEVFQTALGLPPQISLASLEKQEAILNDRLDFEELQNPEFVSEFVGRFIALWDLQNPNTTAVPPLVTSAIGQAGIDFNILATLDGLKSRL